MKKKPHLFFAFAYSLLYSVIPSAAQVTCDTAGNVVLYSNYDGGILNINVDVNIPNLKIGVVSYEMVTINLTGAYVNNISRVEFAGYTTTTHHHCSNSPLVTSIVGAPPGTDTLVFMPVSPVPNTNGYYIIICNYSCDTTTNQGGCNTPDQVAAYFQQEFGGLLRYHFTQYGCWNGTYNISDGGNCCISTFTPPPVALFSGVNHICPGTCTDFINLSTNANAYEWTFTGANPSTSTDENPVGICYPTPGTYPVSLIAAGAGGSDTISLNNFMVVYPYPPPQGITQTGDTLFANPGSATYQWYFDGNLIPGATDYFYVAQANGDYNVVCTDANGCEAEAAAFNIFVGVRPSDKAQLLGIYPNPVRESFFLEFQDANGLAAELSVYNMPGEKISMPERKRPLEVDCHLLPPGIYWLEINSGSDISRIKFVKE